MRIPVLKALSNRNFALLWAGQSISLFGDGIFNVALAWQALQLDDSGRALGLALLCRAITRVATLLFGGALADRYPKRALMLTGEAIQFIALVALTGLVATDTVELWHLGVVAGVTGIGSGIFLSSSASFVPELVPEDQFQSANSLRSVSLLGAEMLGPATGGLLVAGFGTGIAFGIDAITFLICIVTLALMRPPRIARADERQNILREVREGLGYVRRTPWLWVSLIAVGTVGNLAAFGLLPVLIPLIVQDRLREGADTLGLIFAAFGLGGVVGALFMGSRELRLRSVKPAYVMWASGCLALCVVALAPSAWMVALAFAVTGFCANAAEVIWVTLQQTYVPQRLLGRVISTDWLISLSFQPVAFAVAAPLAARFGPGPTLLVGASICILVIGLALTSKQVRHLEKPAEEEPGPLPVSVQRSEL